MNNNTSPPIIFVSSFLLTLLCLHRISKAKKKKLAKAKSRIVRDHIRNADPFLTKSATEIAKLIRTKQITCEQVCRKYITQLETINPYLNSLAGIRFRRALEEAKAKDRLLNTMTSAADIASLPLFFGVPIMSKECYELPGMPITGGAISRHDVIGQQSGATLNRVQRDGGLIILGTGNTSEFCMWMDSNNKVYGQTNNPYDLTRIVGGSSGGTSSATSALGAPCAVTSDVGGSTRIPAVFNGMFGIKPTGGSVSNHRTIPATPGRLNYFCQMGPTARHAEDLLPLLRIMAQNHPNTVEEESTRVGGHLVEYKWNQPVYVEKLRVLDCREQPHTVGPLSLFEHARHPDMESAHERVVVALASLGCPVQRIVLEEMKEGFDIWGSLMYEESATHHAPFRAVLADSDSPSPSRRLGNKSWFTRQYEGSPLWAFVELLRHVGTFGRFSQYTFPAVALGLLEGIQALTPGNNAKLRRKGEVLKLRLNELLGNDGVMIFPSLPTPAPEHGLPFLFRAAESAATSIFNVLELPSVAVPLGLSREGLPVGVQIVGAWGNDHVVLAVAHKLQQMGVAGWSMPVEV